MLTFAPEQQNTHTMNTHTLTLNIGRKAGQLAPAYTADTVATVENVAGRLEDLFGNGLRSVHLHTSDTEPTVVAVVDVPDNLSPSAVAVLVEQLAERLYQDAIAYTLDGTGYMVGPLAEQWGPFNPAYFILPDGSRMA